MRPRSGRSGDDSERARPSDSQAARARARPPSSAGALACVAVVSFPAASRPPPPPSRGAGDQASAGGRGAADSACAAAPPPRAAADAAAAASADGPDPPLPYRVGLAFAEAPEHVRFPNLLRGYRSGGSYGRNIRALFELHTETMNAWTMIAGALLSVLQLRLALREVRAAAEAEAAAAAAAAAFGGGASGGAPHLSSAALPPWWWWREASPVVALTVSCCAHAPASVGFHLFRGMGPRTYNLWRRLDQALIFLASVPMAWAMAAWARGGPGGLFGDGGGAAAAARPGGGGGRGGVGSPAAAATAAVALCVACWGVARVASLAPGFRRGRRTMCLFVGTIVACYWAPMAAQAWDDVSRWRRQQQQQGALAAAQLRGPSFGTPTGGAANNGGCGGGPDIDAAAVFHGLGAARAALGALVSLAAGAAAYASGWPERRWPGRFDVFGSSHQLMHVAMVAAHACKHAFLRELWRRRRAEEAEGSLLGGGGGWAAAAVPAAAAASSPSSSFLSGEGLASLAASCAALLSDAVGAAGAAVESARRRRPMPPLSALATSPAAAVALAMALAVLLPSIGGRAGARPSRLPASPSSPTSSSASSSSFDSGGGGGASRRRWRPRRSQRRLNA